MRYEYRIKVEEKNNGQKHYIPQVGEPKLLGGKIPYLYLKWKSLIPTFTFIYSPETFDPVGKGELIGCEINSNTPYYSESEQEAEDIINFHKKQMEVAKGDEIKNVYFIKK